MKIGGFQETSLSDFPGQVAAIVFTQGCNFQCPYCHNPDLIPMDAECGFDTKSILLYLNKRKKVLDGLVITGGEPLVHKETLPVFIRSVRELGLKIKLDTNGSFPGELEKLLHENLIDYVAMDIKAAPEHYPNVSGNSIPFDTIRRSIKLIINSDIPYEFRTTVLPKYHSDDSIRTIAENLEGASQYIIQNFSNTRTFDTSLSETQKPFQKEQLQIMSRLAGSYVDKTSIRY